MSGELKYTSACGACGPAVSAIASCVGEFGQEWGYDSPGSCGDCSFNCVDFGLLGKACTTGTKAKCKHLSYTGDISNCCLNGTSGEAKKSCDPSYLVTNPLCDSSYATYCAVNDRIVSDPKCTLWRNTRPAESVQTISNYCLKNVSTPACRTWCKANADAGNGVCDSAIQAWCSGNKTDPMCACVMSPLQDPRYGINPKCNDGKCMSTGYITQNMRNTICPDITNCDIQAQMLNSGVQLAGVTINQNCGKPGAPPLPAKLAGAEKGSTTVSTTGSSGTSTVTSTDTSGRPTGLLTTQAVIMMFIVFILLIGMIVAVVYYSSGSSAAGTNGSL